MKRILLFSLALLLLLNVSPVNANNEIPKGAQEFADEHFLPIVLDHVSSSYGGDYYLTDSKKITFGPLHPTYTLTREFVKGKNVGEKGIFPTGEYIAVVYQDGRPINVIGTYEAPTGKYNLSVLGYGIELAEALDQLKGGEWINHEAPVDAWYVYNGKNLKPLTKGTQDLMGTQELSIKDYQAIVVERYKNAGRGDKLGMVGGFVGDLFDERGQFTPYSLIIILGLSVIIIIVANNRRLKKKHV